VEFEAARKHRDDWVKAMRKSHEVELRHTKIDASKISEEEKAILRTNATSPQAKELENKFSKELKLEDKEFRALLSADEVREWDLREKALKTAETHKPKALPSALGFADYGIKPRETFMLARGDFRARGEPVQLGFLTVLTNGKTPEDYWTAARKEGRRPESTQQRRALAEWMTDLEHGAGALAARVIVNRVWQHHFGQGLVRTVNDFGVQGETPSHPELLEWLTSEFVRSGWKLKHLHRLIMTSGVYLQASSFDEAKAKIDPDNRLLWRRRPLRIESEVLRDAILSISGTLNPQMFGPAVKVPIPAEAIQARNMKDPYPKDLKDTPATHRRSIYIFHKRVVQAPLMQAFDGPDAQASCGRRENTTVAPQALALLNDPFLRARASDFARKLRGEAGKELEPQISSAWKIALGRPPSAGELKTSAAFIRGRLQQRSDEQSSKNEHLALTDFCQAIFALNEFIYVD
jgi:hypothetical protein